MIDKQISYDHTVLETGEIQVRRITRLIEDGEVINKTYHRHVVDPTTDLSNEDESTKKLAAALYTPVDIEEYAHKQEEALRKGTGRPTIEQENELDARVAEVENMEAEFLANLQAYETEFKRKLEEATADGYVNEDEKKGLWDTIKSWF